MLSVRMGTGVEMVLWLRRFSFLPPRRATSHSSQVHRAPRFTHRHGHFKHDVCGSKRHNSTVSESGSSGGKEQSTGWRYWLAIWRPLPLSVGLAVLAILQWRRIIRRTQDGQVTEVAKDWEITCYKAVPLRAMSRAWGWITQCELPLSLRPWLLGYYASKFKCNLDEAKSSDLTSYHSLSEFFCRQLKDGCRPVDSSTLVSPADGQVLSLGRVTHCKVEQVKGVTYSLQTFLGPPTWYEEPSELSDYFKPPLDATPLTSALDASLRQWKDSEYEQCLLENKDTSLYQCVVYLAPGDYHRFHSPVQWDVEFRRHFQGELLSVNPRVAKWIPDLFNLNERAVYIGRWKHGFFSLTAVGATNVGSIHVYCDKSLRTNQRKWRGQESRKRDLKLEGPDGGKIPVGKGDPFGEFRLGSTVVLIFEAPKDFQFDAQAGERILVGAGLCKNAS